MDDPPPLLDPDEPRAFRVEEPQGESPFLLICDHASARIPRRLGTLGLREADLQRHIASDIGIAPVALRLARQLGAFLILQEYSRLVIDCNRPPGSPQSIVTLSETTRIPGNESVSAAEAAAREREVFRPYHARLLQELHGRAEQGRLTVLVSMHSFVPCFLGQQRPWHAGVLYNRDARLARALLSVLRSDGQFVVGDNEPYSVSDSTDYAIPVYGERRGLLHVEIELRQDLIAGEAGQGEWADRLARALPVALARLQPS